jgi:hypothetical protein
MINHFGASLSKISLLLLFKTDADSNGASRTAIKPYTSRTPRYGGDLVTRTASTPDPPQSVIHHSSAHVMMTFDETTSTLADGDEIMASRMIEREMESMREVSYLEHMCRHSLISPFAL